MAVSGERVHGDSECARDLRVRALNVREFLDQLQIDVFLRPATFRFAVSDRLVLLIVAHSVSTKFIVRRFLCRRARFAQWLP